MGKDTRQKILDCARELFNVNGFNGVSLQDIADAVGISKGNLTYHFNKKEEIMEGLLLENQPSKLPDVPKTLEELDAVFFDIQQIVQKHSYYFLYHAQLSQLSLKISEMQIFSYRTIQSIFREAFQNLYTDGLLREESFSGEYDYIIDALHMASIYWGPFSKLEKSADMHTEYRCHAWGMMYHLLTEKGRAKLSGIIQI